MHGYDILGMISKALENSLSYVIFFQNSAKKIDFTTPCISGG